MGRVESAPAEIYTPLEMSQTMLRTLSSDGKIAKGRSRPELKKQELIHLYRAMLFNRRVDERMIILQRQGRIAFYIGSIGEEAAIIGSAFALRKTDWIVPCYREAGAAFFRGFPLYAFFCQLFGNADDPIKGRQMPNHYSASDLRFTSISSPVGTQIPQATGVALAAKIAGKKEAVLVYFGDGATSQGDFHVGCNFAGVFKAPVVFLCRNNQWAISVPFERQTASESIAVKARAYGFEGIQVDGNDVFAVYEATHHALEAAREGKGPTLIEALTYRQGAHSTSDDPRAYRSDSEVEEWKKKDPISRLRHYLIDQGHWSDTEDQELEEEIKGEIQSNLKKAEKVGPPSVDTIFEDVFESVPWHLREQREMLEENG